MNFIGRLQRGPDARRARLAVVTLLSTLALAPIGAWHQHGAPNCRPTGALTRVRELPEGSGAAASRRHRDRIWSHNDSGKAVLFALDTAGTVTGRLQLAGIQVDDWEAIAVGPCPAGSCLYLADIGDNEAGRSRISVYRLPEPDQMTGTVSVPDIIHASYPDGSHDAETLLVTAAGEMFIVTKGETGPIGLYRFPQDTTPGRTVRLERISHAPRDAARGRITDGSISPDGRWVVLRTNTSLHFYAASEFFAGAWREAGRLTIANLREPQGEGVTFADDGTLYLIGEGGGMAGGTFARLTCSPS